jgi:hypothetical protein
VPRSSRPAFAPPATCHEWNSSSVAAPNRTFDRPTRLALASAAYAGSAVLRTTAGCPSQVVYRDPAAGTVTFSSASLAGVSVVTPSTVIRRAALPSPRMIRRSLRTTPGQMREACGHTLATSCCTSPDTGTSAVAVDILAALCELPAHPATTLAASPPTAITATLRRPDPMNTAYPPHTIDPTTWAGGYRAACPPSFAIIPRPRGDNASGGRTMGRRRRGVPGRRRPVSRAGRR